MKLSVTFVLIVTLGFQAFTQAVENVDYEMRGDKIFVTYDIIDYDYRDKYDIKLKFVNEEGTTIVPKAVSGDIGTTKGGNKKQIIWRVLKDVYTLEGQYKAVVTIAKQETKKHSLIFQPNLPWSFVGIKYAYIDNFGCYFSAASDFGIIEEAFHVSGGLAMPVASRTNIYLGGGAEIYWQEVIVESGVILKFKPVTVDFGVGVNLEDTYYSFTKLGVGFSF